MLDRVKFGGLSKLSSGVGTSSTKSTELARDRKIRTLPCTVLFLNDTQHTFHLDKRAKGGDLLEEVFSYLELSERDYFGLQFTQSKDVTVSNLT